MSQVIIYKNDNNGVSVIYPSDEVLLYLSVQQLAEKDVPIGKPFAIIDSSEIPSSRAARNAWTIDEAELTDGVGTGVNPFEAQQ